MKALLVTMLLLPFCACLAAEPTAKQKLIFRVQNWAQISWAQNALVYEPSLVEPYLQLLNYSASGRALIKAAKGIDPEFVAKIQFGEVSQTESIFSRSFSLVTGQEVSTVSKVLKLKRDQNAQFAFFDFVHELNHFVYKEAKNPYDFSVSAKDFITDGIEGKGGELSAFASECKIYFELKSEKFPLQHRLCDKYAVEAESGLHFNYEKAKKEFYYVEQGFSTLSKVLPQVKKKPSAFISSTGQASYPYSLYREFYELRKIACKNNKKKERMIRVQLAAIRSDENGSIKSSQIDLAKTQGRGLASTQRILDSMLREHCQDMTP